MKSQEEQILHALKTNKDGLHPTYFIVDLHIYQYNARVNSLRERFNCECKNGYRCSAREHIINKRLNNGTTVFVYEKTGQDIDWKAMRKEAIKKPVIKNLDQLNLL